MTFRPGAAAVFAGRLRRIPRSGRQQRRRVLVMRRAGVPCGSASLGCCCEALYESDLRLSRGTPSGFRQHARCSVPWTSGSFSHGPGHRYGTRASRRIPRRRTRRRGFHRAATEAGYLDNGVSGERPEYHDRNYFDQLRATRSAPTATAINGWGPQRIVRWSRVELFLSAQESDGARKRKERCDTSNCVRWGARSGVVGVVLVADAVVIQPVCLVCVAGLRDSIRAGVSGIPKRSRRGNEMGERRSLDHGCPPA